MIVPTPVWRLINNAGIPKNSLQIECLQLEMCFLRENIIFSNRKCSKWQSIRQRIMHPCCFFFAKKEEKQWRVGLPSFPWHRQLSLKVQVRARETHRCQHQRASGQKIVMTWSHSWENVAVSNCTGSDSVPPNLCPPRTSECNFTRSTVFTYVIH